MATAKITLKLDDGALQALLRSPSGFVAADLARRCRRVVNRAKVLCPVDRGRLRASITFEIAQGVGTIVGRVGTNVTYARAVHDGTGIYGPKGRPIRPVSESILRFPVRGMTSAATRSSTPTGFVFAREVKGTPPRPFLKNALPAAA